MNVDDLIKKLSWNQPKSVQEQAVNNLTQLRDSDLVKLCQPNGKDCWENAALVLQNIGYPQIKVILFDLTKWLQDMNWPGAVRIAGLLCTVPKDELALAIEQSIIEAENAGDSLWLYWINDFVNRNRISREYFVDKTKYDLLVDQN